MPVTTQTTVAKHLVRRFRELDTQCAFGIVGDFALKLFKSLEEEDFPVLVTTDEQGAGFAADAYARLIGFGVCAVTYGAGGLKVANAAANAWAEQVPLLILSGAPGVAEREGDPLLHHKVKDFDTQLRVFAELTCAQAVLTGPHNASEEIDRVLTEMIRLQRPGYIEVPRDLVAMVIDEVEEPLMSLLPIVDDDALAEAVADVMSELGQARTAAIHAGAFVMRRGLREVLFDIATTANIPVANSSLARGVFPERHPLGLGMYMGAVSAPEVKERLENSDVVLSFGVLQTDLTLGAFTSEIGTRHRVLCSDTDVTVGYRTYANVPLWAFLPALAEALHAEQLSLDAEPVHWTSEFTPTDADLTVERAIAAINHAIDDRHGLLLDPGEALFSSVDLRLPNGALASAYYATMGYAVPGALGAVKAWSHLRPVVLVGDGAFAMTGLETVSSSFHGIPVVVIVLDNAGYGTQRPIVDGDFNDIPALAVEHLPMVFGTGRGWKAQTERELATALEEAFATDELAIIRVMLPSESRSAALSRLGAVLAKRA